MPRTDPLLISFRILVAISNACLLLFDSCCSETASEAQKKPYVATAYTNSIGMVMKSCRGLPFMASATEITKTQWAAVMQTGQSNVMDGDKPIAMISLMDAERFCLKLSSMDSNKYRLPTKAEWEAVCFSGNITNMPIRSYAWIFPYYIKGEDAPYRVATKAPDANGIYDLHGNVAEWCLERKTDENVLIHFINEKQDSTLEPTAVGDDHHYKKFHQIAMGGGYMNGPASCGCTDEIVNAINLNDDSAASFIGFRVIAEIKKR